MMTSFLARFVSMCIYSLRYFFKPCLQVILVRVVFLLEFVRIRQSGWEVRPRFQSLILFVLPFSCYYGGGGELK